MAVCLTVRVFERAVKVKFVVYLLKTMRLCKCTSLFKPILKTFAHVRSCKKKNLLSVIGRVGHFITALMNPA